MEQEEDFKRVVATIKDLEQLASEDSLEKMKQNAQHAVDMEFEYCLNALASRKQALLSELEIKFNEAKHQHEAQQGKINAALKTCQAALAGGSGAYQFSRDTAVGMWKLAVDMKHQIQPINPVTVEFPSNLVESISKHGAVLCGAKFEEIKPIEELRGISDQVSTLAGSSPVKSAGFVDGNGQRARFCDPFFLCMNPNDGCVYVSDMTNNAIRKITTQGDVSTIAKSSDGKLVAPIGIAYYSLENCFFVCSSKLHQIKKITSLGEIQDFAGSGICGYRDGVGANASFGRPHGIAIDQRTGNIYVTELDNHVIRKITQQAEVSTIAGTVLGFADGVGNAAKFKSPGGMAFDEKTNSLVISDHGNDRVRMLDLATGAVKTICEIRTPAAVAITPQGSIIVASRDKNQVLFVSLKEEKYEVKVIAGSGVEGCVDGDALASRFNWPRGVCFDPQTNICYIADSCNHRIRKFSIM